ncbi:uncharacterized protein LOC118432782 [Branchiostoma floridae]|uniref:Uncharacterized protein LOC118432782 n=1 Tax=Branchiostoma floridae TaxID=7739 RepID=A0A9J7NDF3_BRAFL|nr:uncharacterized protein LOC118432782 [Branchiostoma floridae]
MTDYPCIIDINNQPTRFSGLVNDTDTREEQWADDMALSDDDSAFRTADELENNKLHSQRELVELETRGVQTEIETLLSGFKGVKLTGNGDIPTKPFLDACRRMVPFFDHLGSVLPRLRNESGVRR